jgi:hypothetical protein
MTERERLTNPLVAHEAQRRRVDFGYHLAASCAKRTQRESTLTRSSSIIVSKPESARRVGTPSRSESRARVPTGGHPRQPASSRCDRRGVNDRVTAST